MVASTGEPAFTRIMTRCKHKSVPDFRQAQLKVVMQSLQCF